MRFLPIGIEAHHTCMAWRIHAKPDRKRVSLSRKNLWDCVHKFVITGKPTNKPGFRTITKSTSGKTNSSPVKSAFSEHCNCQAAAHAGLRIELSVCRFMMIAISTVLCGPGDFIYEWMRERFFIFGSPHVILLPALSYYLRFPLVEP